MPGFQRHAASARQDCACVNALLYGHDQKRQRRRLRIPEKRRICHSCSIVRQHDICVRKRRPGIGQDRRTTLLPAADHGGKTQPLGHGVDQARIQDVDSEKLFFRKPQRGKLRAQLCDDRRTCACRKSAPRLRQLVQADIIDAQDRAVRENFKRCDRAPRSIDRKVDRSPATRGTSNCAQFHQPAALQQLIDQHRHGRRRQAGGLRQFRARNGRAAAHKVKQQRRVLILQMLLIRSRRHARPNLNHGTPSFASIWI